MSFKTLASIQLTLSLLGAISQGAQDPRTSDEGPYPPPVLQPHESAWRAQYGEAWRFWKDNETGWIELVAGGNAPAPFAPLAETEWFSLARSFVGTTFDLHGVEQATLVDDGVSFLALAEAGTSDKMAVGLRQVVGGVPVEDGTVDLLFALDGSLLALHSRALPALGDLDLVPRMTATQARARAEEIFTLRAKVGPTETSNPELVVAQIVDQGRRQPRLAWGIELRWQSVDVQPLGWRFLIDAHTGSLLGERNLVHEFDVGGTLRTMATPGISPDSASNPPTSQLVPYARVTSSAGTVFTDVNGNFNFVGASGPLNVTVEYVGLYNDVRNQAGADYTLTVSASTGTGNQILMNPAPTQFVTAQANAFLHVGVLRDWIRSVNPADSHADFTAISNVNINDVCNAYYDGGSVNFYRIGGGCPNTAYSTVVAHEMGHWLNDLYGTGNGSDGMGEGNADVFAMYVYDDPIVGKDFCGSGCHVRNGNNTRQFCGDSNPGCYGEVHADGEVWMGAAWKVRRNLNTSLGGGPGDTVANAIFLGWMNGYNQTQIKSIIEVQWLTLDDDNGDIDDGTPHYTDIDAGFREQGFPGYDLPLVQFSGVTELPDTQDEVGPYVVNATIVARVHPPIQSATVRYRTNGGSFVDVAMTHLAGDLWRGLIPGQQSPSEVDYYVRALDSQSNPGTYPPDAPTNVLDFNVGTLTTFFFNEFEGATDEGWAAGDTGDSASTGVWVRVDPRGTAAQSEDDHTSPPGVLCWVTGQGSAGGSLGENDVDNGVTTLKSPVFDAFGLNDPKVRYWRWYSNNTGSEPGADTFRIDLSNNGGASWTTIETVGPTGAQASGGWFQHEFRIADFLVPSATMRMRFVASDLGAGSVVEAAIDDIQGTDLGASFSDCNGNGIDDTQDISDGTSEDCNGNGIPDECDIAEGTSQDLNGNGIPDECECDATRYCLTSPNSVGSGARITASGSFSVSINDTVLLTTGLPASQFGLYYYGPNQVQIPFGNGLRCVGGQVFRLGVQLSDAGGTMTRALDVDSLPSGGDIDAGDTWNFQCWYRDPADGGAAFNLSDGLSIRFCD